MQVREGTQLGKALVTYSVAALHVELSKVVQAGQTAQLFTCKSCITLMHEQSYGAYWSNSAAQAMQYHVFELQ